jgi:serine/threonine protein phosphatase PrpC
MPATDDDRYYGITGALLGVAPSPAVTTREIDCAPGDRFVLCSDGAWGVAGDDAIAAACGRERAAEVVAAISDAATRVRDDVAILAVAIA